MTKQSMLTTLVSFKHLSSKSRKEFLRSFEKKMLYRTTKTENPTTTYEMVQKVLDKYTTVT